MTTQGEWRRLGAKLEQLSPEKFLEILEALRETVGVHEVVSDASMIRMAAIRKMTAGS